MEQHNIVLMATPPSGGVVDVLDPFFPDIGSQIPMVLDQLTTEINGHDIAITVLREPLRDQLLQSLLNVAPLRDRLAGPVAAHGGGVMLTYDGPDLLGVQNVLTMLTATTAELEGTAAVFIPELELVTTDVLYQGEASGQPELTWFGTRAAGSPDGAAARTVGLGRLLGHDVELRTTAYDPAGAFRVLREAVAGVLGGRGSVAAGGTLTIDGATYSLTPGASVFGDGDVLQAVAAPEQRRKGWFGRH